MSEDGDRSLLLGEMGSMGEMAATLGASPAGAKQPDTSHNRNEHLGVLFDSKWWRLSDGCHQCEVEQTICLS